MADTPKAAPATPKAKAPAPAAPAPAKAPAVIGGIAIFGHAQNADQDPVQAAMDAAVAEHNAAELKAAAKRLAPR